MFTEKQGAYVPVVQSQTKHGVLRKYILADVAQNPFFFMADFTLSQAYHNAGDVLRNNKYIKHIVI